MKYGFEPKVVVDPRIDLQNYTLESMPTYNRCDPGYAHDDDLRMWGIAFEPLVNTVRISNLAFSAAAAVFNALRPAHKFVEVIRISFASGYTEGDVMSDSWGEPSLRAEVIIVEPISDKKIKVGVWTSLLNPKYSRYKPNDQMMLKDEDIVSALVQTVQGALTKKVTLLKSERKIGQTELIEFNTAFVAE